MTESFAELFEQSLADKQMQPGSIVQGTVVEIRSDAVVVNAGLKSEGLIPLEQFYNEDGVLEVKVGDQVEVALDALGMASGKPGCPARKPSVPGSGAPWRKRSRARKSSRA
jgi:ribosomal protein S1